MKPKFICNVLSLSIFYDIFGDGQIFPFIRKINKETYYKTKIQWLKQYKTNQMKVNKNYCKALCLGKKNYYISMEWKKAKLEISLFKKCLEVSSPKSICAKKVKCIYKQHE